MKMTRQEYKEQVEAQLEAWAAKLERLQAAERAVVEQRKEVFLADIADGCQEPAFHPGAGRSHQF